MTKKKEKIEVPIFDRQKCLDFIQSLASLNPKLTPDLLHDLILGSFCYNIESMALYRRDFAAAIDDFLVSVSHCDFNSLRSKFDVMFEEPKKEVKK